MGRSEVLDQGLPSLVLQLFEGGRGNAHRKVVGLGLEEAWPLHQKPEHNLSHRGIAFIPHPSLSEAKQTGGAP
jgi:hypothetical protein